MTPGVQVSHPGNRNLGLMRSSIVIALIAAACAMTAPAALADATNSSNWAGYAVHKPGVLFHTVSGTWRQPDAKCTPGAQSYSAFWVGLGGFSLNAPALEQTGTEVDCSISGKVMRLVSASLTSARRAACCARRVCTSSCVCCGGMFDSIRRFPFPHVEDCTIFPLD